MYIVQHSFNFYDHSSQNRTRLTHNFVHLRSTKESLTLEYLEIKSISCPDIDKGGMKILIVYLDQDIEFLEIWPPSRICVSHRECFCCLLFFFTQKVEFYILTIVAAWSRNIAAVPILCLT